MSPAVRYDLPTISVVTPSLDQVAFLPDAVESVAAQSHPALEHLVFDAESTDGSVEYLQGRSDIDWVSEPDDGQSDALNKGFLRAKGEVIAWLNADDRYRPGAFAAVARYFADHPETDVVYGDISWIDGDGVVFEERPSLGFDRFALRYQHWLTIPSAATFFRSSVVRDGHLIDPACHWAMDYEFFLCLANAGYRFDHLPVTLADFRIQPEAKTSLGAREQLLEHRRAAIDNNPRLLRLPSALRVPCWQALSVVARCQRTVRRARAGHFAPSMRPGTRPDHLARPAPWARTAAP